MIREYNGIATKDVDIPVGVEPIHWDIFSNHFFFHFPPWKMGWLNRKPDLIRSILQFFRGVAPIRLDLMPAESDPATSRGEQRFFALQIDVNQQGCIKFHDGRRFTTLRI